MKNQTVLEVLTTIIYEEINRVLRESKVLLEAFGEPPTAPPDTSPPSDEGALPAPEDPSSSDGGGMSGGSTTGGSGGATGSSPEMGAADGAPDGLGGSDGSGVAGGMGDFSGGFGGGGGGGGGSEMDTGDDPDAMGGGEGSENPDETGEVNPFKDAETLEDRLQVILDTAETLANETADPQKVLKHVKGLIQLGFAEPEKAAKTISDLFDTQNPVLQQVSKRLALFTFGV